MGRPKGSKNHSKFTKKSGHRGRPKGSTNKPKRSFEDYKSANRKVLACSKCENDVVVGGEAVSVVCSKCVAQSLPTPDWGYHKKRDPNAPKRKRGRPRKDGSTKSVSPSGPKRPRGRPRTKPILPPKATAGYGRGWHLKAKFTAPDGKKFAFGKPC
jgi:hypothetical protein